MIYYERENRVIAAKAMCIPSTRRRHGSLHEYVVAGACPRCMLPRPWLAHALATSYASGIRRQVISACGLQLIRGQLHDYSMIYRLATAWHGRRLLPAFNSGARHSFALSFMSCWLHRLLRPRYELASSASGDVDNRGSPRNAE